MGPRYENSCAIYIAHESISYSFRFMNCKICQILTRIRSALNSMIEIAAVETRSSCLAAISHSSYLRLLIGAVDDSTVFSASLPQSNCGINVIDFPHPGSKSTTYDHKLVPSGKVIRVNEKRHLSSIPSDQASSIRTLVQSL